MEKEFEIPSEKNFNLSKVKLNPNGGLSADYQVTETVGGEPSVTDYHATVTRDIHPDLARMFEDLRPIVGRVFNITSFLTFLESDEMKLTEPKKALARNFADELIRKIDVRGVSWSGSDDNIGVVITAVAQISFGFEEELETIVNAIKKEVYEFLFKGKQAQLSLFGESGAPAEETVSDGPGEDMPEL